MSREHKISLLSIFSLGVVVALSSCDRAQKVDTPVRVASWGGQFQKDLFEQWVTPAAEIAGIEIKSESWDGNYGTLTARIERNLNDWDLIHVEDHFVNNPNAKKLFQSFPERNLTKLDVADQIAYAVPVLQYGYILTYRNDAEGMLEYIRTTPSGTPDWTLLWEVFKVPGRRGFRDFPVGNIEIALLSIGTSLTELYDPSNDRKKTEALVDKALSRLEEIEKDTLWWSSGDVLQKALTSGEIVAGVSWSGRVLKARRELSADSPESPIKVSPENALVATDWWIIPMNSRNEKNANSLLEVMWNSDESIDWINSFCEHAGYSVPVAGLKFQDPIDAEFLTINSVSGQSKLRLNSAFWGTNFDWINRRWMNWRNR